MNLQAFVTLGRLRTSCIRLFLLIDKSLDTLFDFAVSWASIILPVETLEGTLLAKGIGFSLLHNCIFWTSQLFKFEDLIVKSWMTRRKKSSFNYVWCRYILCVYYVQFLNPLLCSLTKMWDVQVGKSVGCFNSSESWRRYQRTWVSNDFRYSGWLISTSSPTCCSWCTNCL